MRRSAIAFLALLPLATPALAQSSQGPPDMGIDTSGTMRKLSVRDATLGSRVPLAVLDTTAHAFVVPAVPVEVYGAKGDSNGTTGNGTDDTAAIEECLSAARPCELRAGATYRVTSRIDMAGGSGLFCAPAATIYADPASFNLTDLSAGLSYGTNAVVLYASGGQTAPYTPAAKITIQGCKIVGGAGDGTTDGRWVQAIGLLNVAEIDISGNELVGFPLGYGIHAGSIGAGTIQGNWIHNFYEDNPTTPFTNIGSHWQITAIGVDSDRINSVTSDGLRIVNNRCENMLIGTTAAASYGVQSDCININGLNGKNIQVIGNYLSHAGEGIDNYSDEILFADNIITDAAEYGIKVVNGASNGIYSNNVVRRAGRAGIVLAPGGDPASGGGGNTENNLFSGNNIDNIDPDGTKGPLTGTGCFRIEEPGSWSWHSNYNVFSGNKCRPGPLGRYAAVRLGFGVGNVFSGNDMVAGTDGEMINPAETGGIYATTRLAATGPEEQVASGATTSIFAATGSNFIYITGNTNITSFGAGIAGEWRIIRFANALTVTHNATSLIIPGGTRFVFGGDMALVVSLGGSNARVVWASPGDGSLHAVVTTVSALPSCSGANQVGVIRAVSDANSTTYNAVAAGGGSNNMPVYCNGTNWVLH